MSTNNQNNQLIGVYFRGFLLKDIESKDIGHNGLGHKWGNFRNRTFKKGTNVWVTFWNDAGDVRRWLVILPGRMFLTMEDKTIETLFQNTRINGKRAMWGKDNPAAKGAVADREWLQWELDR